MIGKESINNFNKEIRMIKIRASIKCNNKDFKRKHKKKNKNPLNLKIVIPSKIGVDLRDYKKIYMIKKYKYVRKKQIPF